MKDKIKEGDIISVHFNNSQYTLTSSAIVLSTPCVSGDSWILEDTVTKDIYYVSEVCTIIKRETKC